MQLHKLPKTTKTKNKRPGRGYGGGKGGHTTGRGQKGQNSRSSVPIWFEGGQLPQIRRFPFIRGKSRFKSLSTESIEVNLTALNNLKPNTEVTPKVLVEAGIVTKSELKFKPVKILGRGELTVPLIINLNTSTRAREKILAAGGKVQSGQPD